MLAFGSVPKLPEGTMELSVARSDGVAVLTLNRPHSLNALTPALQFELLRLVEELAADDAVGAMILTGTGRAFCSGGDVKAMAEPQSTTIPQQVSNLLARQQVIMALRQAPKVTIAAVNGIAMGAGLALAMACDFRIAAEGARFGAAYAKIGLTGDFGISWLLQQEIGAARARTMLLSAEAIDARLALEWGIVGEVVPAHALMETAEALARRYAEGPRLAHAAMKRNLLAVPTASLAEMLVLEAEHLVAAKQTADHKEAIAAFAEKRPPRFVGR